MTESFLSFDSWERQELDVGDWYAGEQSPLYPVLTLKSTQVAKRYSRKTKTVRVSVAREMQDKHMGAISKTQA